MTANNQEQKRKEKIEALLAVVGGARRAALFLHDNPDPDAIASGFALRYILWRLARVRCELVASGTLRRPENGEMIRELRIRIRSPEEIDFRRFKLIACLDTQPQAGNNSLPRKVTPKIVIDHHPARRATEGAPFADLRVDLGATSTILTQYLLASGLAVGKRIATALFYGIKSDTMNIGRRSTEEDIEAYMALFPYVDQRVLARIESPPLDSDHYMAMVRGIVNARLYGNLAFADLGVVRHMDEIAQEADLLIRTRGVATSIVLGVCDEMLFLSIRILGGRLNSARTVRRIIGRLGSAGGHGRFAGGRISLARKSPEERQALREKISSRIFEVFKRSPGEFEFLVPKADLELICRPNMDHLSSEGPLFTP